MAERKTDAERAAEASAERAAAARQAQADTGVGQRRESARPMTEKDARTVDAEAADQMLSTKEQEKVGTGQGRGVDSPAVVPTSAVDPNRALDLPPHLLTGDMKADAERAYGVSNTGAGDESTAPRTADRSAHSGAADEQPKGESNPK